ncbi:MAG: DUF192 domain-containing protein [Actinomycetota bacterium]|nr:DUF192 domain-containing protein [Actinomycetota bacterium]
MDRLPRAAVTPRELDVRVAVTARARLLGLAGLSPLPPGVALLLPEARSIHTCFMRFPLDLLWLDSEGRVLRVDPSVAPWRLRGCRRARSVVELSASGWPARDLASLRFHAEGAIAQGFARRVTRPS